MNAHQLVFLSRCSFSQFVTMDPITSLSSVEVQFLYAAFTNKKMLDTLVRMGSDDYVDQLHNLIYYNQPKTIQISTYSYTWKLYDEILKYGVSFDIATEKQKNDRELHKLSLIVGFNKRHNEFYICDGAVPFNQKEDLFFTTSTFDPQDIFRWLIISEIETNILSPFYRGHTVYKLGCSIGKSIEEGHYTELESAVKESGMYIATDVIKYLITSKLIVDENELDNKHISFDWVGNAGAYRGVGFIMFDKLAVTIESDFKTNAYIKLVTQHWLEKFKTSNFEEYDRFVKGFDYDEVPF